MGRLVIILLCVAFLGFLGLIGYAYSGFLRPEVRTVVEPVSLPAAADAD